MIKVRGPMSYILIILISNIFSEITEFYHCPPGYCGEGCLNQCACTINAHCNPVKCCVCNEGFTGQSCDTR